MKKIPVIRLIERSDLAEVGRLHCEAFPKDTRSQLGAEVVARYFEYQLARRNDVYALGAFETRSGELLGFCFGGQKGVHARGWITNNLPLVMPRLLIHPKVLAHLALRKLFKTRLTAIANRDIDKTNALALNHEIFSLAVKATKRNRGVGKALMREQEAKAAQRSCAAIYLTSPVDDQNTIAFYERIGFRKIVEDEIWTGRMVKPLKGL